MYESEEDLQRLQTLLDRTLARANPHLAPMWAYAFHPENFPE